jgi:hypothetical protein
MNILRGIVSARAPTPTSSQPLSLTPTNCNMLPKRKRIRESSVTRHAIAHELNSDSDSDNNICHLPSIRSIARSLEPGNNKKPRHAQPSSRQKDSDAGNPPMIRLSVENISRRRSPQDAIYAINIQRKNKRPQGNACSLSCPVQIQGSVRKPKRDRIQTENTRQNSRR